MSSCIARNYQNKNMVIVFYLYDYLSSRRNATEYKNYLLCYKISRNNCISVPLIRIVSKYRNAIQLSCKFHVCIKLPWQFSRITRVMSVVSALRYKFLRMQVHHSAQRLFMHSIAQCNARNTQPQHYSLSNLLYIDIWTVKVLKQVI